MLKKAALLLLEKIAGAGAVREVFFLKIY